jgi:hypothetical protein
VTVLFPFFFSALAGAAALAAGATVALAAAGGAVFTGAVGAEAEEPIEYFYLF